MKKLLVALLIPAALALPACDDTVAAAGIGFVGGALVGASIGHDYGYYDGYYRPYYGYNRYRGYGGYWGNDYGWGYYDGHHGWNNWSAVQPASASKGTIVSARGAAFAKNNGTSFAAGERVVKAFDRGAQGDLSGLNSLGLTRSEMEKMVEGRMPSAKAIDKMSRELNLHPSQTTKIVKRAVAKAAEYRRAH